MPRGFHPSPQLFRIPEDAHADEEIDEDFSVGQQLAAGFSPVVWVAILRDDCILVDIGEEDVPQNVIETAQGLLWEQGNAEGWMEHCTDVLWKGLRYTESPFSFACVYNSRQLSNLECQNWIMEQVRWTATMRDADPVWRNGEYHACQTLFAPLLQERLQSSGDVSSIRQTAEDKYDSFEPPMDSAASRLSLANPFGDKFDEEERENLEPSDEDDEDLKEAVESEQKTIIGNLFRNKGGPNTEAQKKSVQQQKNQSMSYKYVPTTPPRQASGSPIRSKPSPPCNGSPPKATEELVRRLARKQAELDRRRQEERENRLSPRRQVQRSPDTQQDSDAAVKPGDIGSDVDSGSMTSATADDEEELGSSNADNPGDDAPWKCWFLPSLPHAKPGPLAP